MLMMKMMKMNLTTNYRNKEKIYFYDGEIKLRHVKKEVREDKSEWIKEKEEKERLRHEKFKK